MKFKSFTALSALFTILNAEVILVPNDYSTIQNGINAASNGDSVLVAPGIYNESIDFNGKEMMGRFERVPRGVIEILNSLLREGVHVQSFTYVRHRWEKKRDSFNQRKTRELREVKASDFKGL